MDYVKHFADEKFTCRGMAWVTLPILKIWDPYNVIGTVKYKYQSSRRLMNALTARYKYS